MSSGEKSHKKGNEYVIQKSTQKLMEEDGNIKKSKEPEEKTGKRFSTRIDDDKMLTQREIANMLTRWEPEKQLTIDSVVSVVGFRRQGKTKITEYMIHQYMKHNEVDACYLFSKSGAGFDNIPSAFRYKDIKVLDDVIEQQLKVNRHNKKCNKKDRVKSRVICIIDDFIDSARSTDVKRSNTLVALSSKGRHISQKLTIDGTEVTNGIMTIIISQSFTHIPPVLRQNTDWTLCSALANRLERKKLVESYFTLYSSNWGLREAYSVYDVATNTEPYLFAVIHGTCSAKRDYNSYIFTYKAPKEDVPKARWSAPDDEDVWENDEREIFFWA